MLIGLRRTLMRLIVPFMVGLALGYSVAHMPMEVSLQNAEQLFTHTEELAKEWLKKIDRLSSLIRAELDGQSDGGFPNRN